MDDIRASFDELPFASVMEAPSYSSQPNRSNMPNNPYLQQLNVYQRQFLAAAEVIRQNPVGNQLFDNRLIGLIGITFFQILLDSIGKDKVEKLLKGVLEDKKREEKPPTVVCTICMEKNVSSVFLECGHAVACYDCAIKTQTKSKTCPICREPVTRVVRTYGV